MIDDGIGGRGGLADTGVLEGTLADGVVSPTLAEVDVDEDPVFDGRTAEDD